MEIQRVIVDPRFKVNYASFYLFGLESLVGSGKMEYRCIDGIDIDTERDCRIGFAMIVVTEACKKKVFVDYGDWADVIEPYYNWSDVYAKINVRPEDANREKLMVIGPSFGVRLWNPLRCMFKGLKNFLVIRTQHKDCFKRSIINYLMDYAYMFIRRKKYAYYHEFTQQEQKDYFFSFNTLWYDPMTDGSTNKLRGDFMRECKKLMERFDGGFFYIDSQSVVDEFPQYTKYLNEYSDMIFKKRISMSEYDRKSRKSWFVFSTPSVAGCHGWKIAEFLCEGKAIVSTPILNLMPGDFKNGVHYIEVRDIEDMSQTITDLKDNTDKINSLKQNAFYYFNEYLAPESVIKRILHKAIDS